MRSLFFFMLCLLIGNVSGLAQDLNQELRKLSYEQKRTILDYMRSKGADIDEEIRQVYQQISEENQGHTLQFMQLFNSDPGKAQRTTVHWNQDTIAFGKVEEGSLVLDSFLVTNTGQRPYLIHRTQTSCDCTVLNVPEYPIMPGEQAVIRVEFDSSNKIGKARGGLVLYDNSTPNQRTVLYMDGVVVPRKSNGKNPWD
jgi:hypothetical protein